MDYQVFCELLDELKVRLSEGKDLSIEDLLERSKQGKGWRNFAALYSLRSAEHFYTLLRKSKDDPYFRQMLYDLHVALNLPVETDLRPLTRMIRYLSFYEQTGKNLDQLRLPYTMASEEINQLLRSLNEIERP
jgi:hypothetical protein